MMSSGPAGAHGAYSPLAAMRSVPVGHVGDPLSVTYTVDDSGLDTYPRNHAGPIQVRSSLCLLPPDHLRSVAPGRDPMTSIVGKRYSGNPSTNSPVNTPTYGASVAGLLRLCGNSVAHPASPRIWSAKMATLTDMRCCLAASLRACMTRIPERRIVKSAPANAYANTSTYNEHCRSAFGRKRTAQTEVRRLMGPVRIAGYWNSGLDNRRRSGASACDSGR